MSERPAGSVFPRIELRARPRDAWFLVLALAVVALDQALKWAVRASLDRGESYELIGSWLRIVHFTNSGAAFGMFQGAGPLLALTSIAGTIALLVYLFNPGFAHPLVRLGLALMLGGAAGNLIDRVAAGEVVDFVKVPNWPAFNVADSAITVGVIVLIWAMLWTREPSPPGN